MGVLDARANAEKVTYPVVGEIKKDASNVIDYDIQEEITTDTSAVFNANNDTTTGMATVIPGVNAPKLKLSTSIYVDKLEIPTVGQILQGAGGGILRPIDTSTFTRNMTIVDSWGTQQLEYYNSPDGTLYSGMKVPITGRYKIDATYPHGSSTYGWTIEWRLAKGGGGSDTVLHTYTTQWDSTRETETFSQDLTKGDILCILFRVNRSSSTQISLSPVIDFEITKL